MWRPISAAVLCFGLAAGCAPTNQGTPRSGGPGAGQLPRDTFPLNNARVVTQSGVNTAMVEVPRSASASSVRRAAAEWCGAPAQATRISSSRHRGDSRQTYLVRCG